MILKKEHANKLLNVENSLSLVISDKEFSAGDTLMVFNNSDENITIESNIPKTYASGHREIIRTKTFPPRCLINAIFIDETTVVLTKGES